MSNHTDRLFGWGPPEWVTAIRAAEDAHEHFRYCVAHQSITQQKEARRKLWAADAHVLYLWMHLTGGNNPQNPKPFPIMVVNRLWSAVDEISRGNIPEEIELARSEGRPTKRWEKEAIAKAIYFVEACKRGDIACNSPVKLVSEHYGVKKQTVRNWLSRRDHFCHDVAPAHSNLLEESMRNASVKYRVLGRGIG